MTTKKKNLSSSVNGIEESSQWEQNTNTNNVNDPLAAIYNENQWRIGIVSPLYNLQYSIVKLKQYASKIRQALVSNISTNSSTKYTVQFEIQPLLKYSEDDSDGLMITVLSTIDNNKTKVAYASILLSWGVYSRHEDATHLPYILERGEQKIGNSVKATLQTIFDCNIKPLNFTQHQLLQFGFNFVENDTSRNTDAFTLLFTTPQMDHEDKVKFNFDIGDVHLIWNGVKNEVTEQSELVNLAYQMLRNQIFYMIMLDISVLDLREVILPKAEVKSNGSVKMKTPEIVNSVFTVLNEINNIYFKMKS